MSHCYVLPKITKVNCYGNEYKRKNRHLTGMFRDRESAENAYNSLSERGYTKDDVNLVMSDETRKKYFNKDDDNETEPGDKAMEKAGVGSATGGTPGAIVGLLLP